MAKERIKLTVQKVNEIKKVGNQGAQKLEFSALNPEGKNLWYFSFSPKVFDRIKENAEIDVDVEVSTREHQGNTYTDRKVVQLYEEGQPITGQRQSWSKMDNTASIEAQTAFKGIMELASRHETPNHISGKFADAFDLALDWAIEKLGGKSSSNVRNTTYTGEEIQAHMVKRFGKEHSKDLTADEIKFLISDIKELKIAKIQHRKPIKAN